MKLEQQVTSLEISKQLKNLEVKQDAQFSWYLVSSDLGSTNINPVPVLDWTDGSKPAKFKVFIEKYSAFTVAELLEIFPKFIEKEMKYKRYGRKTIPYYLTIKKNNIFSVGYENTEYQRIIEIFEKKELIEAAGKMLINLIENKIIKT